MRFNQSMDTTPIPILDFYTNFMNLEDELKAWKYLDELASNYLCKYATTLEQDISILSEDDAAKEKMDWSIKNCVR